MAQTPPTSPPLIVISVLIIEDVEEMRELLTQVMANIPGVQLSGVAKNGSEARLEFFRRRPDLVILDEILPGESSLDLLQELVALEIPVILMTGLEPLPRKLPPGARNRISKPGWTSLEKDQLRIRKAIFEVFAR